jgi:hypothetical protein
MAIRNGWDGALYVGTTSASSEVANLNSWTLSWTGDALEKTCFGQNDRTYDPGERSAVVDFAGYYESTKAGQKYFVDYMKGNATNTAVTVYCYYKRTTARLGFRGSGPITALTIGGAVDGLVPISGSVQISGGMSTV